MKAEIQNKLREDIRNIAIIAHVDHGKTTLVDKMLRQGGAFKSHEGVVERVMDSNDLERERGITILAKNTSVHYKQFKINIVDTPGHADFSGEVERTLNMVNGVLLLVDAFEGAMPQTKFVLRKALELNLRPIVVINKIDRADARPKEVVDQVIDLFLELEANDDQLDFPIVYASAKAGFAKLNLEDSSTDLSPLFDTIISRVGPPAGDETASLQMLVTSLDYDNFVGRIALGRIFRGKIRVGETLALVQGEGANIKGKVTRIIGYEGLKKVELAEAAAGEIIGVAGFEEAQIGATLADPNAPEALPTISIGEPTISMNFMVNTSPFAGKEGKFVTSRNLRERLYRELRSNVALRIEDTGNTDVFKVSGRGELHLSILIETMRREGYEFAVSRPTVILKEIDGKTYEPIERLMLDIEEAYIGTVMEGLGRRRGEMVNMGNTLGGHVRLEFEVPSRGLIGYRSEFLTATRGTGIMNYTFSSFQPHKGEITSRTKGALISMETGEAILFSLHHIQERGVLFVSPGEKIYEGMVIGEHSRANDLVVNASKKKHLTNFRSSTAEDALVLTQPRKMSLEEAIAFLADDELLEITPQTIRLRKKYLSELDRKRLAKK
ncbi:translational GTPase TypA [Candidatus Manganitrophus noduliformans]|uniref:Large ribosomal subunit assembly factor BipA n=1 Tax=Candidatus Manganitrophus noduliformans TaxID=2606439 RepID=A0A7X6DU02_9BACT|nr:translational GTPase TypA [Candidatus Manganitrophus noduliformans]NKE73385.1 translational GTPase TypA [Candidatus Manganitrophus noduliformans]